MALDCLHRAGKIHMDIKPSNVVLDSSGNAILIDISGIGGITRAWCAPEVQDTISSFELSFNVRQWSDVWAYGRLLLEITKRAKQSSYVKHLKSIADELMKEDIQKRLSLPDAILQRSRPPSWAYAAWHTSHTVCEAIRKLSAVQYLQLR